MTNSEYIREYDTVLNTRVEVGLDNDFHILQPDNPLMLRFQNALKNVLEKQLNGLTEDVTTLEGNIAALKKQKDGISEVIYKEQEEIQRQQVLLSDYQHSIYSVIQMKDEIEAYLNELKTRLQEEEQQFQRLQKKNIEYQKKLDFMNFALYRLEKWTEKQDSDLLISQNIINQNKYNKQKCLRNKQMQDVMLMKFEGVVMKLSSEIGNLKNHLVNKSIELDDISRILSEKSADAGLIMQENSRLFQLWQSVILVIEQRDNAFLRTKNEFINLENDHKAMKMKLGRCKEDVEDAINRNEILVTEYGLKEKCLNTLTRNNVQLIKEKDLVEHEIINATEFIECSEKTLKLLIVDKMEYTTELTTLNMVIKNIRKEKQLLEELIISHLQDQIISNDGTLRINAYIQHMKQTILEHENILTDLNYKYTDVSLLFDDNQWELKNATEYLDMIKNDINDTKEEIRSLQCQLNYIKTNVDQKNAILERKICDLECLNKKVPIFTPIEERIQYLHEDINSLLEESQELKVKWLRKQNQIIKSLEKKSEQISHLNLIQKQMFVLEYKKSNLSKLIQNQQDETTSISQLFSSLFNTMSKLNYEYSRQKGYKNMLDNENFNVNNQYLLVLKECEYEMLQLVREIEDVEREKESLYFNLVNMQHDNFSWEKKVKLACEVRQHLLTEQSTNGEIGNMKIEIHHMEIRHSQLKRAQEKLVSDLEMCALKRENIIDSTMSQQKVNHSKRYFRQLFSRKLDGIKNKISQNKLELKRIDDRYSVLNITVTQLKQCIQNNTDEKDHLLQLLKDLDCGIRDICLQKHKNLDSLVHKQRKLGYMSQARIGHYAMLYRSTGSLEMEYLKQSCLNSDLTVVSEAIYNDFPLYTDYISRVLHILHLSLN